jgi:streptomycin 6-kinase
MVAIPTYFLEKARRQFGAAGPAWVEALPSLLARCIQRWDLADCRPIENLSINLVCYATSPTYGEVVLKIQGPHNERFTEMTALELYGGVHACRCLECDREQAVMLLERLLPGDDLRTVRSKDEQLAIGAEMLRRLPIALDGSHGFPHYRDWLTNAFTTMERQFQPDKLTKHLMASAWELFQELDDASRFLLHGDLHHENILKSSNGAWKVIDPQGVIGPPLFECGRFIENHVIDDSGLDGEQTFSAIAYLAEGLQQPRRSVAGSFFILHLLSMLWGYEMNYTSEILAQGIGECGEILRLVGEV